MKRPLTTKPLLHVLAGNDLSPPPVWLMRQAGRYLPEYRQVRSSCGTFLDLCYTPEKAMEVALQPMRRFGFDAAILFSDILVVPDALGCNVTFVEGQGPRFPSTITRRDDVDRLDRTGFLKRLSPVIETTKRLRGSLDSNVALIGFAGAPWTVAAYMVEGGGSKEFACARRLAYEDEGTFEALIDLLVEATVSYLGAQIGAGADVVQIFDSWAGLLPPEEFEKWVIRPTRIVVERLKAAFPDVPVIGFPGNTGAMLSRYALETEITCLALNSTVPLVWARQELGGKVVLQGNLDPLLLLAGGEALDRCVDRILRTMSGCPFVFNLGHGVVPGTPLENVKRMVDRVRAWGSGDD